MPSRPGPHVGCHLPFHAAGCPDWIPEDEEYRATVEKLRALPGFAALREDIAYSEAREAERGQETLRDRLAAAAEAGTPGRGALDDLRFELKQGDLYEQHLASRIEDGLDAQTVAWEAFVRDLLR